MVVVRIVAGVLFLAHGLVHLLYLVPDVTQFSTQRSWLVPEAARQDVAVALIAAVIVASAALALAIWGVPGLTAAWPVLAVLAGGLSFVLLVAYWDTQLVLGVAIDATMVTLAVVQPGWLKDFLT
ncbi:hypothetical protein [Pedococcus bigeumensis]|uniref:hypothetical protein n=1 Tax=Pedococcus bigeumensis TaxID=433644 RepID=UPI002FE8AFD6